MMKRPAVKFEDIVIVSVDVEVVIVVVVAVVVDAAVRYAGLVTSVASSAI